MTYKIIGLMSGSSMDGLDLVYAHLQEVGGKWSYQIIHTHCAAYTPTLRASLQQSPRLSGLDLHQLDIQFGHHLASLTKAFIQTFGLSYQIDFVVVHGHSVFHQPSKGISVQIGSGAVLATQLGLPVIDHLRLIDLSYKGSGAPIVPIGEKLLFEQHELFLNIGGIMNISYHCKRSHQIIAFDISPANAILNQLASREGLDMDKDGQMGRSGNVSQALLERLSKYPYFKQLPPKSLDNSLGRTIQQDIDAAPYKTLSTADKIATYTAFLTQALLHTIALLDLPNTKHQLLVSGGGALNTYLIECFQKALEAHTQVSLSLPSKELIEYKEALIMCLIGALRWREENNVLCSVTGATKDSVNGCIWYATH